MWRTCPRCGETKAITEFNRSTGFGHQYYCRECQSAWYREHKQQHIANVNVNSARYRERNARLILEYLLSHPCVDCGETDPSVLEFDHMRDKLQTISRLKRGSSPPAIFAEISKCEVRCVNCHLRRTGEQFGWHKVRAVLEG